MHRLLKEKWYKYARNTTGDQGLVIDEKDGRTVAVVFNDEDTAALAASTKLLAAVDLYIKDCENEGLDYNEDTYRAAKEAYADVFPDGGEDEEENVEDTYGG